MRNSKHLPLTLACAVLAFGLGACGAQSYVTESRTELAPAPGSFLIPAKVDIIMAQDDSGSIQEIYGDIARQVPIFLQGLENSGWDYHFTTIPLLHDRAIIQATASHHDANYGSSWTPAYPGQPSNAPGMLKSTLFRRPENFTYYPTIDTANVNHSDEDGFINIQKALQSRLSGTGFLRSDALLVVLVVGNGEDGSGVTYSTVNGFTVPNNDDASFNSYMNAFRNFRPLGAFKFYSAVAPYKGDCLGGRSYHGARYERMASALYGQFYDVCSQPVSLILNSLSSSLQERRVNMRTRYVFLGREPEASTISVAKNGAAVPQSATNGWTYVGNVTNVYAIDYPVPMNQGSGYAIELHGSAKLLGDDKISVNFKDKGLRDTSIKN